MTDHNSNDTTRRRVLATGVGVAALVTLPSFSLASAKPTASTQGKGSQEMSGFVTTQTDTGNEMDAYAVDVIALADHLDLKKVDAPVFVMHGEDDQADPLAFFRAQQNL